MKSLLKLKTSGRGGSYSWVRGLVESMQGLVFARAWPARLLEALGPRPVEVIHHHIPAGRSGRKPLRLAFASDLHIGPLTPPSLVDSAFTRLAELAPDVLVLGGDYVFLDVTSAAADRLARLVERVPAPLKVAVLGNHDLWTDNTMIESALAGVGVRVLVNDALRLPPPHDDVVLVGLDDPLTGRPDAERAFSAVPSTDEDVRVVVAHSPEVYPSIRDRAARLMLCGHTHGGQIATPRGPIVVYGEVGRRYPAGRYELEGLTLFVSRGVGAVDLPLRMYAPPDVALMSLA